MEVTNEQVVEEEDALIESSNIEPFPLTQIFHNYKCDQNSFIHILTTPDFPKMHPPQQGKPSYNKPQPAAATGFPVIFDSDPSIYSDNPSSNYQPPPPPPPKPIVEWSTGLCDCCSDPGKSKSPNSLCLRS